MYAVARHWDPVVKPGGSVTVVLRVAHSSGSLMSIAPAHATLLLTESQPSVMRS